jgi:class 3 adenylate cyclase
VLRAARRSSPGSLLRHCGAEFDAAPDREEGAVALEIPSVTERRVVTVLFADLVGFTARSEQEDPQNTASFVRDSYGRTQDVVRRFGALSRSSPAMR